MNKFLGLLTSRKFWASLLGLAGVLYLYFTGDELPVEDVVDAIMVIVGIYVGSVAIEDGLHALSRLTIWKRFQ